MNTPVDRRTFLHHSLGCAATCMAMATLPAVRAVAAGEAATPSEAANAATVHDWLTGFVTREEKNLDRKALVKLLEQRGAYAACGWISGGNSPPTAREMSTSSSS
jgi:hypothetical protein